MKVLVLTLLFLPLIPSAKACDQESLDYANQLYQQAVSHIKDGSTLTIEILRARKNLLDTQFCAGILKQNAYCANSLLTESAIVSDSKVRYEAGATDITAYLADLKELNRLKAFCHTP